MFVSVVFNFALCVLTVVVCSIGDHQQCNPVAAHASLRLVYTLGPAVAGGVPGGVAGGVAGGISGGVLSAPPPPPPPPVRETGAQPSPATRIRVGGTVQQVKLISRVNPTYPPLARQARIAGTVRLEAIIAKDGTVQSLHVLSGPPLLIAAAQEAVKQWIYQPTLLNGVPVEVQTIIDVNFTLSAGLPILPCGNNLHTEKTGKPVTVTFRNESDSETALLWINPDGERKPYQRIAAGQRVVQPTYEGHVWMLADREGACLAFFQAGSSDAEATFVKP